MDWIVEVIPLSYLVVDGENMTTTSNNRRCTRFSSYVGAMEAAAKYYQMRKLLGQPHVFRPDWLKDMGSNNERDS